MNNSFGIWFKIHIKIFDNGNSFWEKQNSEHKQCWHPRHLAAPLGSSKHHMGLDKMPPSLWLSGRGIPFTADYLPPASTQFPLLRIF